MYFDLLEEFDGESVVDFRDSGCWEGADVAYRLRSEDGSSETIADQLAGLLDQPGSEQLTTLVVGEWSKVREGVSSAEVVAELVRLAPRLPELRSLFLGEMTYDECEFSGINQSDLGPLLNAYPKLETLRVRGGLGLAFSKVRHEALRDLAIETAGLPRSAICGLFLCELPSLENLELFLGEEAHGFDGAIEDLQPLLDGQQYPNLKRLGLMNSAIANELAAAIVDAPIVARLQKLDLSMGNLDSKGARSLLRLAVCPQLRELDITHHYASAESIQELIDALPCDVIADNAQEEDEDGLRPIYHD